MELCYNKKYSEHKQNMHVNKNRSTIKSRQNKKKLLLQFDKNGPPQNPIVKELVNTVFNFDVKEVKLSITMYGYYILFE